MGDIQAGVTAINKSDPQAVLVIGSGSEAARLIKELRRGGGQAQFVTLSNNAADSFIKELGEDARGLIITQVVPGTNSSQMSIASEYREPGPAARRGAQQCRHGGLLCRPRCWWRACAAPGRT
ncbi:hypothetical protein ACU4GD_03440 [Cupriavidus basilensis]